MGAAPHCELEIDGRTVRITNPDKVYFSARGNNEPRRVAPSRARKPRR